MKALQVRGELMCKRGYDGKDKDGHFFGRILMLEEGETHEVVTTDKDLFESVPKDGQKMLYVGELVQKLSAGSAGQNGKTYVNKSYELKLISLHRVEVAGSPRVARPVQ